MLRRRKILRFLRLLLTITAALPLIFSFIFAYFQLAPEDQGERLSFDKRGEFKILFVGGFLERFTLSAETEEYLERIIDTEKPDLVILGGNNIRPATVFSELFLRGALKAADAYAAFFDRKKIYFSVISGSFEGIGLYDKSSQIKRYMRSAYFVGGVEDYANLRVFYDRKRGAVNNYRIPIFIETIEKFTVFIIDTQGKNKTLEREQEWYTENVTKNCVIFSHYRVYSSSYVESYVGNQSEFDADIEADFFNNRLKAVFSISDGNNFTFIRNLDGKKTLLSSTPLSGNVKNDGEVERNFSSRIVTLYEDGRVLTYEVDKGNYLSV